jgi:hypothetical protein
MSELEKRSTHGAESKESLKHEIKSLPRLTVKAAYASFSDPTPVVRYDPEKESRWTQWGCDWESFKRAPGSTGGIKVSGMRADAVVDDGCVIFGAASRLGLISVGQCTDKCARSQCLSLRQAAATLQNPTFTNDSSRRLVRDRIGVSAPSRVRLVHCPCRAVCGNRSSACERRVSFLACVKVRVLIHGQTGKRAELVRHLGDLA